MKDKISTLMAVISALCLVIVFLAPSLAVSILANYALIALLSATSIAFFVEGVKYKMPVKFISGVAWAAIVVLHAMRIR